MRHATAFAVAAVLTMMVSAAQYDPSLQYQRRGDREEGLRSIAVGSGPQVELVSARIEGPRPNNSTSVATRRGWAETLKVRFYLPDPTEAYLIVRSVRAQSRPYWLTFPARAELRLAGKWAAGTTNEYSWPTASVLARLPEIQLEDLGAVVRMGQQGATNIQQVLPAALFDQEPINAVEAYRFSLRPVSRVNVDAAVLHENREIFRRERTAEDADSPFTVRWTPGTAPEGWYRLVLSVSSANDAAQLDQEIRFYHRPLRSIPR